MKQGGVGRMIPVYDARSWPVIPCGNVFVTSSDSAHQIKSSILATNITPDKKRKSSKHALAIGSSFGHVHAFLRDESRVLQELEKKTTEEQCLMLIKKPKSSSRQMLKSQSWTNLSASDSHIYKQLDGVYPSDQRRHHKYKMKRKQPDLQPLPSEVANDTMSTEDLSPRSSGHSDDGGFLRYQENGGFLRDKENRWTNSRSEKSISDVMMTSYNGQSSAAGRTRYDRKSSGFSSREINNNQKMRNKGSRLYRSQNDISNFEPPRLVEISADDDETCTIKSDEMYSPKPVTKENVKEQNETDNSDPVSRCRSLGDLTTGLTLSLVGQRKAGSIQSIPLETHNVASNGQVRERKVNDSGLDLNQNYDSTSKDDSRGLGSPSEGFRNRTKPKICMSNNSLRMQEDIKTSPVQAKALRSKSWGILPDKGHGITLSRTERDCDGDSSQNSSPSTRSSDKTPTNRSRRTLPNVPKGQGQSDIHEKKRKYAEMVRMRVSSAQSNNSESRQSMTSPSSESQVLENIEETISDKEVSNYFYSDSDITPGKDCMENQQNVVKSAATDPNRKRKFSNGICNESVSAMPPSSVRSCDSGQTTLTSLSSTMDSGYLTTDAEADMYSLTSYTKSLQRSAHTFYSSNKLNGLGNSGKRENTETYVTNSHLSCTSPSRVFAPTDRVRNPMSPASSKGKSINIGKGADMTSTPVTSPQGSKSAHRQMNCSDSSFSSITSPQGGITEENPRGHAEENPRGTSEDVPRGNPAFRREEEVRMGTLQRVGRYPSASQTDVRSPQKTCHVHRQLSLSSNQMLHEGQGQNGESRLRSLNQKDLGSIKLSVASPRSVSHGDPEAANYENEVFKSHEDFHKNDPIGCDPGLDKNGYSIKNEQGHSKDDLRRSMEKLSKCDITVLPSTNVASEQTMMLTKPRASVGRDDQRESALLTNKVATDSEVDSSASLQKVTAVCDNNQRDTHTFIPKTLPDQSKFCDNSKQFSVPNLPTMRSTSTSSVPVGCTSLTHPFVHAITHPPKIVQQVPQAIQPINVTQANHVTSFPPKFADDQPTYISQQRTVNTMAAPLNQNHAIFPHMHPTLPYSSLPKMAPQHLYHDYVNIPSSHLRSGGQGHTTGIEPGSHRSACASTGSGPCPSSSVQNIYESQSNLSLAPCDNNIPQERYNTLPGKWKFHTQSAHVHPPNSSNKPSLCQLLLSHDILSLTIPANDKVHLSEYLTLADSSLTLTNLSRSSSGQVETSVTTPQGKYPKIGGPGSAFTPVKTSQSKTVNVTMVTVASINRDCPSDLDLEGLREGDVIVELNERWVLCEPIELVQSLLKCCTDDVHMIVARDKGQMSGSGNENKEEEIRKKDSEIEELTKKLGQLQSEVQRKNKTIQDIASLIPRKRILGEKISKQTVTKTTEINGNVVTTDIIVNGLADDEFIV